MKCIRQPIDYSNRADQQADEWMNAGSCGLRPDNREQECDDWFYSDDEECDEGDWYSYDSEDADSQDCFEYTSDSEECFGDLSDEIDNLDFDFDFDN